MSCTRGQCLHFSKEAGALNTRRLLQSDKDLPAETWPPAQEENARATNLCDSIFYKWVTHLHEAVCKLVQPAALENCQLAHRQAEGLCSGWPPAVVLGSQYRWQDH